MIKLKAYVSSTVRWHQPNWGLSPTQQQQQQHQQQQQQVHTDAASALSVRTAGTLLESGTLFLEAVLRGRRLPITLCFDDDEVGRSVSEHAIIDGSGSGGSRSAINPPGSRSIGGLVSDVEPEGMVPVTISVHLVGGDGGSEDPAGRASSAAAVADVLIIPAQPGMLRINAWCSCWGVDGVGQQQQQQREGVAHLSDGSHGHFDVPLMGGHSTVVGMQDGVGGLRGGVTASGAGHVSLPDLLVASEQVLLVPSQWAFGASGLSTALMDDEELLRQPEWSGEADPDLDPLDPGHRSKALADVALVVEAVFSTEDRQGRLTVIMDGGDGDHGVDDGGGDDNDETRDYLPR